MSQETPRDEFDDLAPAPDGRRGAHRARRSWVASLLSAGLVAGATAAVAGGAFVLLHDGADPSAPVSSTQAAGAQDAVVTPAADAAGTPSPTATPSATASATASETAAATASEDAGADESPSDSPSESASAEAGGEVDTTLPLVVLNGTRTSGLAAKASSQLHRLGWRVQSTGNDRSGATGTTVTYRDSGMAATAAAVADDLGGEAVRDRSATEGVLTVVLGPDHAG